MNKHKEDAWKHERSERGPDLKLFQVRFDWLKNPRNDHTVKATVLESRDWVNVVALTSDNKIIVVRQHRFGTGRETTEIPAGIVEHGETSKEAAIRELQEETGYTTDNWKYLGYVEPNPAFIDNKCHHWVARDVVKTAPTSLDLGENLTVSELTFEELRREIAEHRFRHSLAFTALAEIFDLRGWLSPAEEAP